MDAQTLFLIVSKWPEEAWPEGVSLINGNWCPNHIPNHLAVMLFESAGLRHLIATGHAPESQCIDGQFFIGEWSGNRAWSKLGFGPTLIEAISQAITSVNQGKGT